MNTALLVAQEHGVAEEFAASTLAAHFEGLENPNDLKALTKRFEAVRALRNWKVSRDMEKWNIARKMGYLHYHWTFMDLGLGGRGKETCAASSFGWSFALSSLWLGHLHLPLTLPVSHIYIYIRFSFWEALNVAPEKLLEALKDPDKEGRICMITLLQMGLRQLC